VNFDFNALRGMEPEEMIRRLEAMQAQAEQQLAAFEALKERVDAITVTCTDPEGRVTVTVGSDGYISDLAFDPAVSRQGYRSLGPVVIATLAQARVELEQRLNEVGPR
jgi:DNA-binding protein YbaB